MSTSFHSDFILYRVNGEYIPFSSGIGSVLKFDFFIHPTDVVLSDMDSLHIPLVSLPAIISTHGLTMFEVRVVSRRSGLDSPALSRLGNWDRFNYLNSRIDQVLKIMSSTDLQVS